jgi:hypothetical protein
MMWFWRVTLANPSENVERRWRWASALNAMRAGYAEGDSSWIEMALAIGTVEHGETWFGEIPSAERAYRFGPDAPETTWEYMAGWHFTHVRPADGDARSGDGE